jgi:hypothetical protein
MPRGGVVSRWPWQSVGPAKERLRRDALVAPALPTRDGRDGAWPSIVTLAERSTQQQRG